MKRSTVIALLLALIIVGTPILAGYAAIPTDILPSSIGDFLYKILKYWIDIIREIIHRFQT